MRKHITEMKNLPLNKQLLFVNSKNALGNEE
jgi:hypothetical protein